jgi:hypothetical protein
MKIRTAMIAVVAAAMCAGAAHASGYLRIGGAAEDSHGKWIVIESASWGGTGAARPQSNGPGTVTIVQRRGDHSARFARLHRDRTATPEMVLRTGEPGSKNYLEITLHDVVISSYSVGSGGGTSASIPTETLSLNYDKITTW